MSHTIELQDAIQMVQRYRDGQPPDSLKALSLPQKDLLELMDQPECDGLRFYLARQFDGSLDLIIVAYDVEGNDLLNIIKNHLVRCPDICSATGELTAI